MTLSKILSFGSQMSRMQRHDVGCALFCARDIQLVAGVIL
jgi:hypothetical protein